MKNSISAIWSRPAPSYIREKLRHILHKGSERSEPFQIFFRDDDVAHVEGLFSRLMHTFLSYEMPLCLAVVPGWLDNECWKAMQEFRPENRLWCWHQHGTDHSNHEIQGKKCEFGASRSREAISKDLVKGREILFNQMGDLFYPVFTPPWNRCSLTTLNLLKEKGYLAVSRSNGAKPSAKGIMPDIAVNVDLHTRRENEYTEGWENLINEFDKASETGRLGLMLHHQRMNDEAFAFLELLLTELRSCRNVSCLTFREILENKD